MTSNNKSTEQAMVISPSQLLNHWQGHRNLTRKLIDAFPEDKLFTYSIGGMRPFSAMILEFVGMGVPGVRGIVTGKWEQLDEEAPDKANPPKTKEALLKIWDAQTSKIKELWNQVPSHRFQEQDKAFGQWEGPGYFFILYWIENEVHHRGQAYVYLRSLGIEPPPFWDRE
jgi:uncharacterized damage-inducible protein DinB